MKIAALIPARKGSKRFPNKNLLRDKENYFLEKVISNIKKASDQIDIFVSTDCSEIENIALKNSAKTLDRDGNFIDDHSTVVELINFHFNNELKEYDLIYQTYIHAICIDPQLIKASIEKIKKSDKNFLISVGELNFPIEWSFNIKDKNLIPKFPNMQNIRSQDLDKSFFDAGQFYCYKKLWLLDTDNNYEKAAYQKLNFYQTADLDEKKDLDLLNIYYEHAKNKLSDLS
tara:strand:+ start:21631 stop:22320 length:690 start_codon:yes stop_codon:yes gene_type:complete